jgi:hypothetical protein
MAAPVFTILFALPLLVTPPAKSPQVGASNSADEASVSAAPGELACAPECRPGFVCVEGKCVSACNPPCPDGYSCNTDLQCVVDTSEPSRRRQSGDRFQESRANFHFNALGILQLGLDPTLELGGAHWSLLFRVRPMNTGLLSYYAIGTPSRYDNFVFGMGGGIGFRGWALGKGNMRGLYFGGTLEYAYTRVDDEEDDLATWRTHSIVPMGELGYRWVFGRFLVGLGLVGGAAVDIASSDTPIGPSGCAYEDSCNNARDPFPFGMLRLDLGWMIGR